MKLLLMRCMRPPVRPLSRRPAACLLALLASACTDTRVAGGADVITVLNAGALARPLRASVDSFARANGLRHLRVEQENAGSIETARKITELGRTADVVALADTALFSRLLAPKLAGPVVPLGRTRMVLAYTPRSRGAREISVANWYRILTRPEVEVGRSDPTLDPAGYRALFLFQLAERHYGVPGLAARLEAAAPARNMRPKSADLVALLQTGNLDYAWEYESVARNLGLTYLRLPPEIDLGEPADAALYRAASVVIKNGGGGGGRGEAQPIVLRGAPIVFGAATLKSAPHGTIGSRFITYLTSPAGRAVLASYHLDPLQ
ncbi:MAG: extracellular solute-binding protein [Gemmatimonadaceae bacterium]